MSKFQIIVTGILIAAAAIAVLMFMGVVPGFGPSGIGSEKIEAVMWGIFSKEKIRPFISKFNDENSNDFSITYEEKNPETYKEELINAMASGNPPDLWFMTQDMIFDFKDKIYGIPMQSFSERGFMDTFIDSGYIYIDKKENTIIALPCLVDPMVLYWNRELFSSEGLARPPQYWEEFLAAVPALTKFDSAGNIIQSGAALGVFGNVKNAEEILSTMILQTGNPIVDPETFKVMWMERGEAPLSPAESSLRFFIEFSNPKKTSYSWNRSLKNSNEAFSAGSLAMYFGFAGEIGAIKQKNPHLDFDIADVPQIKGGKIKAVFGNVYSLAISKGSPNKTKVFPLVSRLIGKDYNKNLAETLFLAPVRRDVLSEGNADSILSSFYKSGIMARTWLEPNPLKVSEIFEKMIESAETGKLKLSDAASNAAKELGALYK